MSISEVRRDLFIHLEFWRRRCFRPHGDRKGFERRHAASNSKANITTARMTHIMWLTNLAPENRKAILFLPRLEAGPDTVKEIDVRRIARVMNWGVQRRRWLAQ